MPEIKLLSLSFETQIESRRQWFKDEGNNFCISNIDTLSTSNDDMHLQLKTTDLISSSSTDLKNIVLVFRLSKNSETAGTMS